MTFFRFEKDFVTDDLRCIPMVVRYALDTCGVKLKLNHWLQFSPDERHRLAHTPCDTPKAIADYRHLVQTLVIAHTGATADLLPEVMAPPWLEAGAIPPQVQEQAQRFQVEISPEQWQKLQALERFSLIKLSRPGHENRNFYPALVEFGLVRLLS